MRRHILGTIILLVLFSSYDQSSPTGQTGRSNLAIGAVTKMMSEPIHETRHSWKITPGGSTPVQTESVVIEVLEGISVNPSLRSSSSVDFSSLKAVVKDVISPGMTDEEKALALWRFVVNNTYPGPWGTSFDGLEHLTVYGYGYCGTFASVLEPLWWAAGMKARHVNIGNHAATEVYYNNSWHYIDAHRRCFFLERNNKTIASLDSLNLDPDLWDMQRQRRSSQPGKKKYYYMSMHPQGQGRSPQYSNSFTMAKGDVLTLTWQKNGKWCLARGAEGGNQPAPEPDIYANGLFKFHRDLSDPVQRTIGLVSSENIDWQDLSNGYLHPLRAKEEAYLIYRVRVPYFIPKAAITGSFLRKGHGDSVGIDISTDNGKSWTTLWSGKDLGVMRAEASTDRTQEVTTDSLWKYSYLIRVRMRAESSPLGAGGTLLESSAHLFYNPRSLPALQRGENTLTFHDEGSSSRSVSVTYTWQEDLPIRISGDSVFEGEEVTLSSTIHNAGVGTERKVPVAFYLGDPAKGGTEIGRDVVEAVAPQGTATARIKWKASLDLPRHEGRSDGAPIYARIVSGSFPEKFNGNNSTSYRIFKVLNPPDVSVPSASFIRFEKKNDRKDIVTITAAVRNFSSSANYGHYLDDHSEAKDVRVRVFDGEPRKGKQIGPDMIIAKLLPLGFKNVSVDWDISQLRGQHSIYVQTLSPKNVPKAIRTREADEISTLIDLDAYRSCRR